MKDEELEALKLNYKKVVDTIFVDELLPALYEKGIIKSHDTMERIHSEKTTTDRACKLMQRVIKCDKPSAFKDFVDIIQEYYEFLADDLNKTVTKVRRQKRCLKKVPQDEPKRHLGTSDTFLDDVFQETPTQPDITKTFPRRSPFAKPLCHVCKRRIRSEISSEAGLPGLCYYGRHSEKNKRAPRFDSSNDIMHISESSSDDETPHLSYNLQRNEEDTVCKVFDHQKSVQDRFIFGTEVKVPFGAYVNNTPVLDTSQTLLKEKVCTMLSVSPPQAEENTDMHGLSVNYGAIEGFNEESSTQNTHTNCLSSNLCQCAGFFTNCELHQRFQENVKLVAYSSSEIGEDVPDSCLIDFEKEEPHEELAEILCDSRSNVEVKPAEQRSGGIQDKGKPPYTEELDLTENCDMENTAANIVTAEVSHLDKPPCGEHETESGSTCKRSESLLRAAAAVKYRERKAVMFNVSQDEPTKDTEGADNDCHHRHVTLSRRDCSESFGFKYVSGKKRPRYKDDKDYYVSDILPDSLASKSSDMKVMYTMLSVNGHPLCGNTLDDIVKLLENSLTITLTLKPERNNNRYVRSYLA